MNNINFIKFCRRCLYNTSHPFGLVIDEEGICSGCRIHEEKDKLDWKYRENKLRKLIKEYRSKKINTYDCVIPVTGAQDSYFIVHVAKNILGLNPLLVHYNKYFNSEIGIYNLANLRIKFNCDILIQNINPQKIKKITRTTLGEFGSMYWCSLAGHTVFPVQIAVKYEIPLILWGAHQGLEQVGMFSHLNEVEMSRWYRKNHDLMGFEADDLLNNFNSLTEADVWQFRYPEDSEIKKIGVRGIYIGNYFRWDPITQHNLMIKKYGFRTGLVNRTFDTYDYTDCLNYTDIHDYIKFKKNGYSKVTDHASREIRHGRLSREYAISLVEYFQKQKLRNLNLFCNWLGVKKNSLINVVNKFKNNKLIIKSISKKKLQKIKSFTNYNNKLKYNLNHNKGFFGQKKYITIGKGYITK